MTDPSPKFALADYLRRAILVLDLAPGSDLDETRLCDEFGLSRTPLREVFRQLAGEGFITLRENRGARVSEMSHTSLRDFFVAAPMIYSAILQLAALHATAPQIAALREAQARFRATLATGTPVDRALANNRFHEITGEMAGNVYLLPSFHRLLIDHARISMTFYRPRDAAQQGSVDTAADQHDAIIAAIEAGDAAAAARLAEDHWALSRGRVEQFVMPGALDVPMASIREAS